jgi:hypothetical protein
MVLSWFYPFGNYLIREHEEVHVSLVGRLEERLREMLL